MICQMCGSRPAMVHYEELDLHGRRHLWLCEDCAEQRRIDRFRAGGSPPGGPSGPDGRPGPEDSGVPLPPGSVFDNFLDQHFQPGLSADPDGGPGACPACGFELTDLGTTNQLGCPTCYDFFRDRLRPMLVRIHHHSSHLGRVPRHSGAQRSLAGEIARHRLALEKAIVAERYEEAARLRDRIARLESREQAGFDSAGEPDGTGEAS